LKHGSSCATAIWQALIDLQKGAEQRSIFSLSNRNSPVTQITSR
jgi:hypothetical protein